MIISNGDLWNDYKEVNEDLDLTGDRALSADKNSEDMCLIVGSRKWSWDNCDPSGPNFSSLGLQMIEHILIHDKYDLFIYIRE
jgi:hypothetical protein